MKNKNLIFRVALIAGVCVLLLAWIHFIQTNRIPAWGSILFGLGGVIVFRSMVRDNKVPGFERQDDSAFKLRPVFKDLAKSGAFILAGFVITAMGAYAVRIRVLPDTYVGVFLFLIPAFGLLGWGFFLLLRAMSRAMVGGSSH